MKNFLWMLTILLLLAGCAGPASQIDLREVEPVVPIMQEPAPPQTAGSLWSESRAGLYRDVKAATVGDIVTVAITENASASKEAKTSTSRDSSMSAGITSLLGLERSVATMAGLADATSLIDAEASNDFEGNGKTSRKEDLVATLTTQVVEVMPNGNLRIKGNKTITVNSETQIVQLSGIVRPSDISTGNVVNSQHVLNARIAYVGAGVISDKQQPGWLVRGLDKVWPF